MKQNLLTIHINSSPIIRRGTIKTEVLNAWDMLSREVQKIYFKKFRQFAKKLPNVQWEGIASDSNEGYEAPIKYIFKNVKQFQKKLPNVQWEAT